MAKMSSEPQNRSEREWLEGLRPEDQDEYFGQGYADRGRPGCAISTKLAMSGSDKGGDHDLAGVPGRSHPHAVPELRGGLVPRRLVLLVVRLLARSTCCDAAMPGVIEMTERQRQCEHVWRVIGCGCRQCQECNAVEPGHGDVEHDEGGPPAWRP